MFCGMASKIAGLMNYPPAKDGWVKAYKVFKGQEDQLLLIRNASLPNSTRS